MTPCPLALLGVLTLSTLHLHGQHAPESPPLSNPDLNQDGVVDVLDLVGLLNLFDRTDLDRDGVWDSQDDCVGWYDVCGVCNGPGPTQTEIVAIEARLDSIRIEQTGEWFVFQTGNDTLYRAVCDNPGCTDPLALNFDRLANVSLPETCAYPRGEDACGGKTAIVYQEELYPIHPVGNQCWFSEDLRSAHFQDGSPIPVAIKADLWSSMGSSGLPAMSTLQLGGRFSPAQGAHYFNFPAVLDDRGLCPPGWHVPTDADWQTLLEFGAAAQGPTSLGTRMKAGPVAGLRHMNRRLPSNETKGNAPPQSEHADWVPHWDGTDAMGFSAEPVGLRDRFGFNDYIGHASAYWSATAAGRSFAWAYFLGDANPEVGRMNLMMSYGLSVRCVH